MDAVSKIFLHAEKTCVHGHTILGLVFVYRDVVIPCAVRLWTSKEYCDKSKKSNNKHKTVEFKKLTELAADTITSVKLPSPGNAIVLFDRFYLCDTVVKACESKGYTSIRVVKNNRNFFPDGRPNDKKKVRAYSKNVLDRDGRLASIAGSQKEHCVVERVGEMKKLGRIKLAFRRQREERSRLIVATNYLKWGTKSLIEHYRDDGRLKYCSKCRSNIWDWETIKFYETRLWNARVRLMMISHHLLTHLAMDRPGAKELCKGHGELRLSSVEQMQDVLRNMLIEDRIKSFSDGTKYRGGIARKLNTLLITIE